MQIVLEFGAFSAGLAAGFVLGVSVGAVCMAVVLLIRRNTPPGPNE